MPAHPSVLFIGPLPDPITGQSLACRVFLDELTKSRPVQLVDLTKREFKQGISSFHRVTAVARVLLQIWRQRNTSGVIYFTISESTAGNLKDLLIYAICFRNLNKMIVHLHGGAGMRRFMLDPKSNRRRMNQFFLRRVGGAIVLGERHISVFAESVERDKLHIVPNFAEDYLFADADHIRARFSETQPLRVLFLSNMLPGKGYLELIDAFLELSVEMKELMHLDFAGGFESDAHRDEFLRKIEGVNQITYHGIVSGAKKRALFHQAHVFCLPTYYPYEGQPISILEAYASGCVVITTDHSGIRDVFSDQVNGYQVGKGSVADLRAALVTVLRNRSKLYPIAAANRTEADLNYRTRTYTARLISIIESTRKQHLHSLR